MKNLLEINNRIAEISGSQSEIQFGGVEAKKTKDEKKLGKELSQLILVKELLERGVTEDYLIEELKRLNTFVKSKSGKSLFKQWWDQPENQPMDRSDAVKKYNKEIGITETKRYIKTIKFILT